MEITWIKSGGEDYLSREQFYDILLDIEKRFSQENYDIFTIEQYCGELKCIKNSLSNGNLIGLPDFNGTLYISKSDLLKKINIEKQEKNEWINPAQHSDEARENSLMAITDLEELLGINQNKASCSPSQTQALNLRASE